MLAVLHQSSQHTPCLPRPTSRSAHLSAWLPAGICLVGLAGILGHEEAAPAEVPFERMLAGMALVVVSLWHLMGPDCITIVAP